MGQRFPWLSAVLWSLCERAPTVGIDWFKFDNDAFDVGQLGERRLIETAMLPCDGREKWKAMSRVVAVWRAVAGSAAVLAGLAVEVVLQVQVFGAVKEDKVFGELGKSFSESDMAVSMISDVLV